jgi:hypothetical protein
MKLAEKFFNQSYENEKRLRLEAEKAKAEQFKKECTEVLEKIILPKIEVAVKNGLYSADFKDSEFDDFHINLTDFFYFLKSESFYINENFKQNTFSISWKLKDPEAHS